ncbi:MAG: hypothetical protein IJR39_11285, partial [Treponema sp.]|nr:hypothetical protein [Treponema sp.]
IILKICEIDAKMPTILVGYHDKYRARRSHYMPVRKKRGEIPKHERKSDGNDDRKRRQFDHAFLLASGAGFPFRGAADRGNHAS